MLHGPGVHQRLVQGHHDKRPLPPSSPPSPSSQVPSHQELKQIMALHGGCFETYFHRDRVTHIICSNLPDTKLKQMSLAPRWGAVAARSVWDH